MQCIGLYAQVATQVRVRMQPVEGLRAHASGCALLRSRGRQAGWQARWLVEAALDRQEAGGLLREGPVALGLCSISFMGCYHLIINLGHIGYPLDNVDPLRCLI